MNHRIFVFSLVAIFFLVSRAAQSQLISTTLDETSEPPLSFELTLDGDVVTLQDGVPVKLPRNYERPTVKLTVQPYRIFTFQGISFEYPSGFGFEADVDEEHYKNWTLSGNDFKIMYFVLEGQLPTREFLENMAQQFGKENCQIADDRSSIILEDRRLLGSTLHATLAGQRIQIDAYAVPINQTETRLLVFQDRVSESGLRTTEGQATLDVMRSSFKFLD